MVLTVLGLVAGVATQYSRVNKATEFGERFRILMRASIDDMLSEAQDAYSMSQPNSPALATELRFFRVDATTNDVRLPPLPVPPDPSPTNWDPFPSSSAREIRYYKVGEKLLRRTVSGSGETNENVIFELCSGFSASLPSPNVLELTLSTEKDGRVETRTGRAYCPCL